MSDPELDMSLPIDMDTLRSALADGEHFDFIYFWGHSPAPDGRLSASCLSQWWPCSFEVDGTRYTSAEQFMMAGKARLFGDGETLAAILRTDDPGQVKALGRRVQGFHHETWLEHRVFIVERANEAKFGSDPRLRAWLRATHPAVLVEASPEDTVWGIGLDEAAARTQDPASWPGDNLLGFALMAVRDGL